MFCLLFLGNYNLIAIILRTVKTSQCHYYNSCVIISSTEMKEQLMSRKYKLRWQDRGILIVVFILLATIIACVADRSKLYYKRA